MRRVHGKAPGGRDRERDGGTVTTRQQRAEAYAESAVEDVVLPTHDLLTRGQQALGAALDARPEVCPACKELAHRNPAECPAYREAAIAITGDMEQVKAMIATAFAVGYAAGQEDGDAGVRIRRSRSK